MPLPTKILKVFCNPFHTVDHAGRPAGACPEAPKHHDGARRWVGATLVVTIAKPAKLLAVRGQGGKTLHMQVEAPEHDRVFSFSPEVQLLPNDDDCGQYYCAAIRTGELIPADVATAVAAGLRRGSFRPPAFALAEAKRAAIATHDAHYGEEAEHEIAQHWHDPDAEMKRRDDEAKKAATADAKPVDPAKVTDKKPAPQTASTPAIPANKEGA